MAPDEPSRDLVRAGDIKSPNKSRAERTEPHMRTKFLLAVPLLERKRWN